MRLIIELISGFFANNTYVVVKPPNNPLDELLITHINVKNIFIFHLEPYFLSGTSTAFDPFHTKEFYETHCRADALIIVL